MDPLDSHGGDTRVSWDPCVDTFVNTVIFTVLETYSYRTFEGSES